MVAEVLLVTKAARGCKRVGTRCRSMAVRARHGIIGKGSEPGGRKASRERYHPGGGQCPEMPQAQKTESRDAGLERYLERRETTPLRENVGVHTQRMARKRLCRDVGAVMAHRARERALLK